MKSQSNISCSNFSRDVLEVSQTSDMLAALGPMGPYLYATSRCDLRDPFSLLSLSFGVPILFPAITGVPDAVFEDSQNTELLYSVQEPTYLPWNGLWGNNK